MARKTSFFPRRPFIIGLTVVSALLFSGGALHLGTRANADDTPPAQPQAPEVEVVQLKPESLRVWSAFSGHLEGVERVEVRPRVGGAITKILFEEGAIVKKGDPLFEIDPRPFEADLANAKAMLSSAYSQLSLAKVERERARKLVKNNHISQSTLDNRENGYQVSLAAVNAAKADVKTAELNLEFANITAPVDGRVSRAEITLGNVIEAGGQAPVLTTIVSNDTLFAEFDVDEQTYLRSVRGSRGEDMPIELTLAGDDGVVYKGKIHSFDNQLNSNTGTIRARAIVNNTDGVLVPGMYANVRLGAASKEMALVVPERAIGTDQSKKFVYVVNDNNEVAYREVALGRAADGKRIITSGVKAGEFVMVNSLQRVRPGMQVTPMDIAKKQAQPNGAVAENATNKL